MTALAFAFTALVGTQAGHGGPACALALAEVDRVAAERGWQAQARCVGGGGPQFVDATALTVQRLSPDAPLRSGLMTLVARAEGSKGLSSTHRISVRVAWMAPAWVAVRALTAGESLRPADATVALHRWADGVAVQSAADKLPQGRIRRTLRVGEVLTPDVVSPADAVLRGDRVNAVLASGGIEIRLPASVLAPARVGERVRVQPLGRNATLEGLLLDAHNVEVEAL